MKSIDRLSVDILAFGNKAIDNIVKAQSNTAYVIQQDAKFFAPVGDGEDAGAYAKSIKLDKTKIENDLISTKVYTDATVTSATGESYNLGRLLEEGTNPHMIFPLEKPLLKWKNSNGEWRSASVVYHPGTEPQPHLIPALMKNEHLYMENIRKAIKEAK